MKTNKIELSYDHDTHTATCVIHDFKKNISYTGTAKCREQEFDFESERIGSHIAEIRAAIAMYKHERDYEFKPRLRALNQLYYSMKHSSNFNSNSYEARMLSKQIELTQADIKAMDLLIEDFKGALNDYFEDCKQYFEHMRKKAKNEQNT